MGQDPKTGKRGQPMRISMDSTCDTTGILYYFYFIRCPLPFAIRDEGRDII